jgi:hypothetical protein
MFSIGHMNKVLVELTTVCGFTNPTKNTAHSKRKFVITSLVNAKDEIGHHNIKLAAHHKSDDAHRVYQQGAAVLHADRCFRAIWGAGKMDDKTIEGEYWKFEFLTTFHNLTIFERLLITPPTMNRSPLPSLPLLQFRTLPVATTRRIPHLLTTWRTAVATDTAAMITTTSQTTTTAEQALFVARMISALFVARMIRVLVAHMMIRALVVRPTMVGRSYDDGHYHDNRHRFHQPPHNDHRFQPHSNDRYSLRNHHDEHHRYSYHEGRACHSLQYPNMGDEHTIELLLLH